LYKEKKKKETKMLIKNVIRVLIIGMFFLLALSCSVNPGSSSSSSITPYVGNRSLLNAIHEVITEAGATNGFKVVGYMPAWQGDVTTIQYDKVTHINYAFALPVTNGELAFPDGPVPALLVSMAHSNGVKVLISIGGWMSDSPNPGAFRAIAMNSSLLQVFVDNVTNFVYTNNLDGADIDWEYPQSAGYNYAGLMQKLHTALHSFGALCTAAVPALTAYSITSAVFTNVDYLTIMAYDCGLGAAHSPYSIVQTSINYWKGLGLSQDKTVIGMPFYGRDSSSWGDSIKYFELVAQDPSAPGKDQSGVWYYNGVATIKAKAGYAVTNAGGIMVWELSQDTAN
jgi:chitinase